MDTIKVERIVIDAAKAYFLDRNSYEKEISLCDAVLKLLKLEVGCEYCSQRIEIEPLNVDG